MHIQWKPLDFVFTRTEYHMWKRRPWSFSHCFWTRYWVKKCHCNVISDLPATSQGTYQPPDSRLPGCCQGQTASIEPLNAQSESIFSGLKKGALPHEKSLFPRVFAVISSISVSLCSVRPDHCLAAPGRKERDGVYYVYPPRFFVRQTRGVSLS